MGNIFRISFPFIGIVLLFLGCFLFCSLFRSFLNSKVLAICLPTNILLYSFSFVIQIQNALCGIFLITHYLFNLGKPILLCVFNHLQKVLFLTIFSFYLVISMTGCLKKLNSNMYLTLHPKIMDSISLLIWITSTLWCLFGKLVVCDEWLELCTTDSLCYGKRFHFGSVVSIMVILLLLNGIDLLTKSLNLIRKRSEVRPSIEIQEIGADTSDINNNNNNNTSEEDKEMVSMGVHQLTFFIAALFVLFIASICRLTEINCDDTQILKTIIPLINTMLLPGIWILAKKDMRSFSVRRLKMLLNFQE